MAVAPRIVIFVFHVFLSLQLRPSKAQTWIRAGYYDCSEYQTFPVSDINTALFTHLIVGFAGVDSTSYKVSLSLSECLSRFANTVKQKNPSLTVLLSIGRLTDYSNVISMASNASHRKSFIDSSIEIARLYGFQGLDLYWVYPSTDSDMVNMGSLLQEWGAAIRSEVRNSSQSQLILTARVHYSPLIFSVTYPIGLIQQYLNWVHVLATGYILPRSSNCSGPQAALYNAIVNTDDGIKAWIDGGLSANKLVLCLPYFGCAWTLENPEDNGIGAPAKRPAISVDGLVTYKEIKNHINQYGPNVEVMYNATYVLNYWTSGATWIGFDDIEAVRTKVSYAKKKKLLGYYAWRVTYDDNWVLSQAAGRSISTPGPATEPDHWLAPQNTVVSAQKNESKWRLFVIVLPTTSAVILLLGFVIYYCWKIYLKSKGTDAGGLNSNVPNLKYYTWVEIEAATNGFSIQNKLGEGGFGPVYKGLFPDGQEIAVKKLSKSSRQGFEEFKNEVMLAAKILHVNLIRVLGFCVDRGEQMLIYEYMPNKSLDYHLFDPIKRSFLDWRKRVYIIEGIVQGLLYLQEYSRLTIIHRDLKANNVLLDKNIKPKISDFGLARIFAKTDQLEANTGKIVGTYGYVPPEYVRGGIYSTKFDVYSFGVLLLQIISGREVSLYYGVDGNLTLLEYAYELWKDGRGMEFMDDSLNDTNSSWKLIKCLQIALLCVQENRNDRPSILEVSEMLKNEIIDINIPNKPGFSKQSEDEHKKCSINHVTISEVTAR